MSIVSRVVNDVEIAPNLADYIVRAEPFLGGIQIKFRFPNDYGLSVVRNDFTYGGKAGLFEVGLIKYTDSRNWDFVENAKFFDFDGCGIQGWVAIDEIDAMANALLNIDVVPTRPAEIED